MKKPMKPGDMYKKFQAKKKTLTARQSSLLEGQTINAADRAIIAGKQRVKAGIKSAVGTVRSNLQEAKYQGGRAVRAVKSLGIGTPNNKVAKAIDNSAFSRGINESKIGKAIGKHLPLIKPKKSKKKASYYAPAKPIPNGNTKYKKGKKKQNFAPVPSTIQKKMCKHKKSGMCKHCK